MRRVPALRPPGSTEVSVFRPRPGGAGAGRRGAFARPARSLQPHPHPHALKKRPKPIVYGLYGWSPEYGFRYVHPANRRSFELLEPVGKLFEKISEDEEGEWLTLRYDEQQFLLRPELFKEIHHVPPFSFGDAVEEVTPAPGRYRHVGLVSDVFWDETTDTATYQIVEHKRKLPQIFQAAELRAD